MKHTAVVMVVYGDGKSEIVDTLQYEEVVDDEERMVEEVDRLASFFYDLADEIQTDVRKHYNR